MSLSIVVDLAKNHWKPIVACFGIGVLGSYAVSLIASKTGLLASAHCLNPLVGGALFATCVVIAILSDKIFKNDSLFNFVPGFLLTYGSMKLLNSITYIGAGVNFGTSLAIVIVVGFFFKL